jgi:hypothetical protein
MEAREREALPMEATLAQDRMRALLGIRGHALIKNGTQIQSGCGGYYAQVVLRLGRAGGSAYSQVHVTSPRGGGVMP